MKFVISIYDRQDKVRHIPLDHDYESIQEAESEAENIADEEFSENDETWTLSEATLKNGEWTPIFTIER